VAAYENEAVYQQYYAYYQLTQWMAQFAPFNLQVPSQNYYGIGELELEKGVEEETLTADSHSPALSKASNESER
jgi:hypothetical protein